MQTVVDVERPPFRIGYDTRVMMLGSCFAENMGERLACFRFPVDVNPCGIVYNPLSVASVLGDLLEGRRFMEADLLRDNGRWVSLSHHGRFSASRAEECLGKINGRFGKAIAWLKKTDVLIITWGTAWVYRYRATGQVAANCHRLPAAAFDRFFLDADGIAERYEVLLRRLWELRPELKVLLTVSPVRHWKDGAHGNQLSKAVLLLAADRLCARHAGRVAYFPSYEIVMDELRDYRFYAADMLHLSDQGTEYVWERFVEHYMSGETRDAMKRIDRLNRVLLHRPSDPEDEAYIRLRERTCRELDALLRGLVPSAGRGGG